MSLDLVYDLPDQKRSGRQKEEDITLILTHLKKFCDSHSVKTQLTQEISYHVEFLKREKSCMWFPEYGSCILVIPLNSPAMAGIVHLGLDQWAFYVHTYSNGQSPVYEHTSKPESHITTEVGSVNFDYLPTFVEKVSTALSDAKARTGDDRASKGNRGHQRTPAFILSIAIQAFAEVQMNLELASEIKSRGGSTDVGMHTGSDPRPTTWDLVCQTLCYLQECRIGKRNAALWLTKALIEYDLWVCRNQLSSVRSKRQIGRHSVNNICTIFKAIHFKFPFPKI